MKIHRRQKVRSGSTAGYVFEYFKRIIGAKTPLFTMISSIQQKTMTEARSAAERVKLTQARRKIELFLSGVAGVATEFWQQGDQ